MHEVEALPGRVTGDRYMHTKFEKKKASWYADVGPLPLSLV